MKKMMMMVSLLVSAITCIPKVETTEDRLLYSKEQLGLLLEDATQQNANPRTFTKTGEVHWINSEKFDWTEGFFPGTLWYLYQWSGDEKFKQGAMRMQNLFEHTKNASSHDLGFAFNCSFGHGYRLLKDTTMLRTMITAGDALIARFNPNVGTIQSWDVTHGWQAQRGWRYPVIIDNMMNLEMLFELSNITGDAKYRDVAIAHANTTMKNHFREDMSSYHVVDYNPETGEVRNRHTAQGYAHESSWARGQAWGLYGYVTCYRYTQDPAYLKMAQHIADFIMSSPITPSDKVPYWDYQAPTIPNAPRDASAAAITASALIELDTYVPNKYISYAQEILNSLSSPAYRAKIGENHHFLLKHSVGSIPHNSEIDVPLNYADYYYVEAAYRLYQKEKK